MTTCEKMVSHRHLSTFTTGETAQVRKSTYILTMRTLLSMKASGQQASLAGSGSARLSGRRKDRTRDHANDDHAHDDPQCCGEGSADDARTARGGYDPYPITSESPFKILSKFQDLADLALRYACIEIAHPSGHVHSMLGTA